MAIFRVPTTYIIRTEALSYRGNAYGGSRAFPRKVSDYYILHKVQKKLSERGRLFYFSLVMIRCVWVQFFGGIFVVPQQPCSHRIPMMGSPRCFQYHHSFLGPKVNNFHSITNFIPIFLTLNWTFIAYSKVCQREATLYFNFGGGSAECFKKKIYYYYFLWWANQSGSLQTKGGKRKKKKNFAL